MLEAKEAKEANLNEYDQDESVFLFENAKSSIAAWKSHQLRTINQDRARVDVLESLDSTSVLIWQDFAMKFMPAQYREAQSDFFGKRGISWHISVCYWKAGGVTLESQTLIHIMESGQQDSTAVVLIMEHVLQTLKRDHPEIVKAYFRMDNAGCYHSAQTVLSVGVLSQRSGIQVCQIDFSDPQGGKGACDRKAAQIKAHVKSYVNEGFSVLTALDLKKAIESRNGIPGVRAAVIRVNNKSPLPAWKMDGINSLNNFHYSDKEFTVYRAYDIGSGKCYSWQDFNLGMVIC